MRTFLSFFIGTCLAIMIFDSLIVRILCSILFSVIVLVLLNFIRFYRLAKKDPEVRAASELGMSIDRYRLYEELDKEYHEAMQKYGIDSPEADKKFDEIMPRIKNFNEWRRFSEYKKEQSIKRMNQSIEDFYNGTYNK